MTNIFCNTKLLNWNVYMILLMIVEIYMLQQGVDFYNIISFQSRA